MMKKKKTNKAQTQEASAPNTLMSEENSEQEPELEYIDSNAPLEEGKAIKEIKGIKNIVIDKLKPDQTMLINMELRNGMHRTFMIRTKKNSFKFMGGLYLIDNNLKYYKVDSKIWCLDYHQEFTLPVQRKIPVQDIKTGIENSGVCEVESATSPALLERFVKAEIAEGVMKGAPIDEAMKKIILIGAVTAIASIAHLLLFMFKTGMLSSVKIPGM